MSLDFSNKTELAPLGRVMNALQAVAIPAHVEFLLMGAAARDIMLAHAHKIEVQRKTEDVDFAVMVNDWPQFESLRADLIKSGDFSPRPGVATHKLRHLKSDLPLDIVPFGGIERSNRTIAWPPNGDTVFSCFGIREAFAATQWVRLPQCSPIRVPSIPALTILKIAAWDDRKRSQPGKDAPDLLLYLRSYMDCDNFDRTAAQHPDLFDAADYDHNEAGARLLARDMADLLDETAIRLLLTILTPEADENGALLLAHQSGLDLEQARRLIEVLCDELAMRV
jgi:predicted nucleotidyltransferase